MLTESEDAPDGIARKQASVGAGRLAAEPQVVFDLLHLGEVVWR